MITVIDTETTGLFETDRVVEIALVTLGDSGRIIDQWSALVCPAPVPVTPGARAVHHISDTDLATGYPPAVLAPDLQAYVAATAAAHNAAFDRRMVAQTFGPLERAWLCTYRCARHLWPDLPGHSNQVLRYALDLQPDLPQGLHPHRALHDALVTTALLQRMLQESSVADLLILSEAPVLLRTMSFGMHRGLAWGEVPKTYLRWMLGQNFDADTLHTARHHLGDT